MDEDTHGGPIREQLPPPPRWTTMPENAQCLAVHPSGIATCQRGHEHFSSWHSDPQLRLTWRTYPGESTARRQ